MINVSQPTVHPYENFDDEEDAKALKAAFKGFGSDEDAIIEIITRRTNEQRRQIAGRFKTMYGKVRVTFIYFSIVSPLERDKSD